MKNDFDFIKEKMDNSGVNAPEHMDENYVLNRIADTRPQVVPIEAAPAQQADRPKKRRTGRITAIAAAVVAVTVLGTALTVHFTRKASQPENPTKPSVQIGEVSDSTGLIRFSSYDEVHAAVALLRLRTQRYARNGGYDVDEEDYAAAPEYKGNMANGVDDVVGKGADTVPSAASDDSHSETYKQVEGVDEADVIKTDGRCIYVAENHYYGAHPSRISVFSAQPGVSDPFLYIIPGKTDMTLIPATLDEATPDEPAEKRDSDVEEDIMILDMYLTDGRLVILCRAGGYAYDYADDYAYPGSYYVVENKTRVYVYDVADMNHVRLLDTFTQSGSYTSSRMIGDVLYLVTNAYELDAIPCCGRGEDPEEIAADCIYSVQDPTKDSFLIVSAYDTEDNSAITDSKAVLGLGSDVYCSLNNLYISAADYSDYYGGYKLDYTLEYSDSDSVITYGADDAYVPKTKIFKVSLDHGVNFTAYGEVEGYTNNQYSFDEYNGYLRVATTSNNADYEDVNHLFVLDDNLNVVGSVTGFAETESIKAVRYVGNTAYVITYEQTDPLFVIDLSSPTAPVILGEVKISGFSTMLVPVDENTILGIGINTGEYDYTTMEVQDGVKLALFDVSDKSNPKVLDSKPYINFSSEVEYNPKALVYNPDRGDYIIPLNYYRYDDDGGYLEYYDEWDDDTWDSWYDSHVEMYGAVLNFRVEGGSIVVTEQHTTSFDEVSRCVYVGNTVYAISFTGDGTAKLESFSYR